MYLPILCFADCGDRSPGFSERLKMSRIMLFEADTNFVAIESIVTWNCRMFEGLINYETRDTCPAKLPHKR